jgi:hypothetical protein
MATVSITVPDAALPRIVDALCATGGWTAASGARGAFAHGVLVNYLRQCVINTEVAIAQAAALATLTQPTDPGLT